MFNSSLSDKNALVILRTKHWIIHQNHSYNFSSQNSMYHFIFPTTFSLDILWQDLKLRWMGVNQKIMDIATVIVYYPPENGTYPFGENNTNKHTSEEKKNIIIPRDIRSYFSFQDFTDTVGFVYRFLVCICAT